MSHKTGNGSAAAPLLTPHLAQAPAPDLSALYARVAEIEQAGARMLADAAELREGLDRVSAAAGIPLLPVRRRLSAVPPLAG